MVCTARGCACGRPIVIRVVNGKRTPILDASGRRPVRFNGARPRGAGKGGLPAGRGSLQSRPAQDWSCAQDLRRSFGDEAYARPDRAAGG